MRESFPENQARAAAIGSTLAVVCASPSTAVLISAIEGVTYPSVVSIFECPKSSFKVKGSVCARIRVEKV
jgi:hypothetical protein